MSLPARLGLAALDPTLGDAVQRAIEHRLSRHPTRTNRWIRRLWDAAGPQFCLRVGPARAFYDIAPGEVRLLAVCAVRDAVPPGGRSEPPDANPVERVPLAQAKAGLSDLLLRAERQPLLITRYGRAAGLLIGFQTEDDWLEYRLRHDPAFLGRIEQARQTWDGPPPHGAQ